MGDNQYNKYSQNDYPNAHYQVKANVSGVGGNNGASQQFAYDVNSPYVQPGYESNTHLSSLSNCVKRLQTQLNTYLTKIIDEGSEGGGGNYNLGSGEVLNSHLMEQYAPGSGPGLGGGSGGSGGNTPNSASAFGGHPHPHHQQSHHSHQQEGPGGPLAGGMNNGYSYYSNYPPNYPNYGHHHHQGGLPGGPHGSGSAYGGSMITGSAAAAAAADYYSQQYSSFQEPKPKKQKNK